MAWGAEVRVEDVRAWWWPIKLPLVSGGNNAAVVTNEREIYGEVDVEGDGDHAGRRKWLLRGIKARAQPGRLLAILGPSGSGKTTLLNVMAGRVEHGSSMGLLTRLGVEGGVLYNDIALAPQEARQVVGYVLQHDHLLPHLTVRETLRYAGYLRLPPSLTRQRKLQIVEEVIMELGLKDCANRRVGGDGAHGISGGERRRVSIGIQMLTDPGVLFLDEPTSGLDSYTANKLVSTLADLAHQGRTIVCTIHQPRSDIFQLFDDVMLLSKGHQVYYGPAQSMLDYFQRLGYVCPTHTNPADYALDLIAIDLRSPEVERASYKRLAKLTAQYRDAQQQQLQQQRDLLDPGTAQAAHSKEARDHIFNQMKQQHVNVVVQMLVLVARAFKNIVRDKMVIMVRLIEALLMGVCVGGIFYQMDTDNVASLRSRSAALYAIVSLQPYLIMLATIVQYESELKVFSREYFDNMVGVVPYFMSMLLTSLPFSAVLPSVFCAIVYWMAGLRPEWEAFLWFLLIMTVMQYVGEALGYSCIALIRSFGPASLAGNSFATFWTVTAGFLLNPISFPIYLRYIGYTSPFQYAYAALAVVEYKDNEYDCPYPPENPLCLYFDGNYILSQQNLIFDTLRPNLLIVGAMAIGFRIIALLILVLFKRKP